jgi:ferric-dicitrate binding protein FerR (iron transport regulator)
MGWLTRRKPTRQMFEDGIRWVEAIKNHHADAEAFACWAMQSPEHVNAFREAWLIWHDVRELPRQQPEPIERTARALGPCGNGRRAPARSP